MSTHDPSQDTRPPSGSSAEGASGETPVKGAANSKPSQAGRKSSQAKAEPGNAERSPKESHEAKQQAKQQTKQRAANAKSPVAGEPTAVAASRSSSSTAQPTKPTKPTNPSKPTQPTKSTQPSKPTKPSKKAKTAGEGPARNPVSSGDEPPRYKFLVFNALPSWFVSMIVHAALIIMLAVFTLPLPQRESFSIASSEPEVIEEVEEFEIEDFSLSEKPELESFETLESEDLPQEFEEMEQEPELSDTIENPFDAIDVSSFSDQTAPLDAMAQRVGSALNNDLSARSDSQRKKLLREGGGSDASERAVMLALEWLAKHQREDGGWDFDHTRGPGNHRTSPDPGDARQARNGATGLALLPFLGAGQTHLEGKYKDVVAGGLRFLIRNQQPSGGGGSFHEPGGNMYSHGICAIALTEAYAMTQDRDLLNPAQAAVNFIVYAQDPVGGGWRYQPRQAGDTSVVGWQLMALKSGFMGYLQVPPNTIRNAEKFLDSVALEDGARYGYSGPGQGPATTAVGLLSRMYLGWERDHPAIVQGVDYLSEQGPSKTSEADMYYNYYATQVMRHFEGEPWEKWNEELRDWLVSQQETRGNLKGSWHFDHHWADRGGRLYNTAMACMVLEVYYRHLPIYREQASQEEFPLD